GELLTLTADNAVKIGFASGIAESLDEVLEMLSLKGARRRNFESNWAEEVAAFISRPAIASLLTLLGLAALFIEYKTPGFGFFGTVGLILMALVFWGHSIAHLAGLEGAILFFIGFALLGVEIFIIPGFGLFGTAGILLMVIGLILTLLRVPINNPLFIPEVHLMVPLMQTFAILIGSILLLFAILKYLPRSNTMERVGMSLAMSLEAASGYTSHDTHSRATLVGQVGRALSPLRPGGFAMIQGKRVDVVTEGEFIEQDQVVEVERIEGLRVIVIPSRKSA
ncbi:MAG: nodulation protein NfeD, partial [Candidatus Omnitrophica bacterium]|nr:nodulation protein NfeD [Candidatus Omnitrophota bacterium]